MSVTERLGPAVAGGADGTEVVEDIRSKGLLIDSMDWRDTMDWLVEVILGAVGGTSWSCRFKGWLDLAGGGLTIINVYKNGPISSERNLVCSLLGENHLVHRWRPLLASTDLIDCLLRVSNFGLK
jgi:hypothetical protein